LAATLIQLGDRRRSQALAYVGCAAIAVACVAGSLATAKSSEVEPVAGPVTVLSPE
jgi:hypothetical protein